MFKIKSKIFHHRPQIPALCVVTRSFSHNKLCEANFSSPSRQREKTWQIAIDRIVCKYLSSANNDESISLQSCTANSVSCEWHEVRPNSRKWIREGWLLWGLTAGSTCHASTASQAADEQGEFGIWKGKDGKWCLRMCKVPVNSGVVHKWQELWKNLRKISEWTVDRDLSNVKPFDLTSLMYRPKLIINLIESDMCITPDNNPRQVN